VTIKFIVILAFINHHYRLPGEQKKGVMNYKETLLEGITENLIAFSLGKPTDMNSQTVKELEVIMEDTESQNAMEIFYFDLLKMDGFKVTHERQSKFINRYPQTARVLTIFIYA
tara:strand:- start:872 stop:1213 length:342 start_codon:yes stop_codon:yes gene_type:complete